jgi:hypothetical protein
MAKKFSEGYDGPVEDMVFFLTEVGLAHNHIFSEWKPPGYKNLEPIQAEIRATSHTHDTNIEIITTDPRLIQTVQQMAIDNTPFIVQVPQYNFTDTVIDTTGYEIKKGKQIRQTKQIEHKGD